MSTTRATGFAIAPPIEPMLAKLAEELPAAGPSSVRAEVGRFPRDRLSRRDRRVHPEPRSAAARPLLSRAARRACSPALPDGCVLDGEIVIATPHGLDFDALQLRLHPAASRVAEAREGDAGLVRRLRRAGRGRHRRARQAAGRTARPARAAAGEGQAADPPHADDARSRSGVEWLARFEGAGLDGVIAKPADGRPTSPASAR